MEDLERIERVVDKLVAYTDADLLVWEKAEQSNWGPYGTPPLPPGMEYFTSHRDGLDFQASRGWRGLGLHISGVVGTDNWIGPGSSYEDACLGNLLRAIDQQQDRDVSSALYSPFYSRSHLTVIENWDNLSQFSLEECEDEKQVMQKVIRRLIEKTVLGEVKWLQQPERKSLFVVEQRPLKIALDRHHTVDTLTVSLSGFPVQCIGSCTEGFEFLMSGLREAVQKQKGTSLSLTSAIPELQKLLS